MASPRTTDGSRACGRSGGSKRGGALTWPVVVVAAAPATAVLPRPLLACPLLAASWASPRLIAVGRPAPRRLALAAASILARLTPRPPSGAEGRALAIASATAALRALAPGLRTGFTLPRPAARAGRAPAALTCTAAGLPRDGVALAVPRAGAARDEAAAASPLFWRRSVRRLARSFFASSRLRAESRMDRSAACGHENRGPRSRQHRVA